jgi:hypothetical protein
LIEISTCFAEHLPTLFDLLPPGQLVDGERVFWCLHPGACLAVRAHRAEFSGVHRGQLRRRHPYLHVTHPVPSGFQALSQQ